MRSIIGEVIESLHALQKDNLTHFSISTDTVRLTRSGIQIADAPVSIMLADTSRAQALENREQLAIRQISALLYAMLIRRRPRCRRISVLKRSRRPRRWNSA